MSSHTIKETKNLNILEIARKVRTGLLKDHDENSRGNCLIWSKYLRDALIKEGYKARVVQGKFSIDCQNNLYEDGEEIPDKVSFNPLHYWVQIEGKILDITADQFNDELDGEEMEEITFETYESCRRYKKRR